MAKHKTPGTWGMRVLIRSLTVALAILIFWLLGFLVDDIKSIKGPDYQEIEKAYVDVALLETRDALNTQIRDLERAIAHKRKQQDLASDASENLQRTIRQLLDLQTRAVEKNAAMPEAERADLSASRTHFFESQKQVQQFQQDIAELTNQKIALADQLLGIDQQIADQREPARAEFDAARRAHRIRLAFYQLLILVPLLAVACFALIRKRGSMYYSLFVAFGGATLLKVVLVIHEYFPTRYFKYMLIVAMLLVVARLLVYLIRTVARPKPDWLLKRYREAYERFVCPSCDYPIRTGPRRFLYWTRRTAHKSLPTTDVTGSAEPYTCPACGTALFEQCPACERIRHAMLPHCEHCGAEKAL